MSRKSAIQNLNELQAQKMTAGQKIAEKLTKFSGSWGFVIGFSLFIFGWIFFNVRFKFLKVDPYPFILLNLLLSFIAAFQAPIILMSENLEAERDRIRAENDYLINITAEKLIEEVRDEVINIKKEIILLQNISEEIKMLGEEIQSLKVRS